MVKRFINQCKYKSQYWEIKQKLNYKYIPGRISRHFHNIIYNEKISWARESLDTLAVVGGKER